MEDWKKVLSSCGLGHYADILKVGETKLSGNELTVCFDHPEPIPEQDAKRIQDALSAPFIGIGKFKASFNNGVAHPKQTYSKDKKTQKTPSQKPDKPKPGKLIFGTAPNSVPASIPIYDVNEEMRRACICGVVVRADEREPMAKRQRPYTFDVTDYTDTITCKLPFETNPNAAASKFTVNVGDAIQVLGSPRIDRFSGELTIEPKSIFSSKIEIRPDNGDENGEKRIELHLHTFMSTKDGLLSAKEAVKRAKTWGHTALAVTDHGVVQAYPEFYNAAKKEGIQAIFGMEGYLLDDCMPLRAERTYVVVDIETTGFELTDRILEIGAVKIENGVIGERFSSFVNPHIAVPERITKLTGITTEMVHDAPPVEDVLKDFFEYVGDSVLVAHNAKFDVGFLTHYGEMSCLRLENPYVDTLMLARYTLRNLSNHKLNDLTEYFHVSLENHHRAMDDAAATAEVFLHLLKLYLDSGAEGIPAVYPRHKLEKKARPPRYHIVLLVENLKGLNNLYRLVTYAHLNHYDRRSGRPCIPRSLLMMHREGIILGSACEAGELFRAVLSEKPEEFVTDIARFYDYLEIQPIGNNAFLMKKGDVPDEEGLRDLNRRIVRLAETLGKPCVATGDVHFLDEKDGFYRRIIMTSMGFTDAEDQAPLYFKTTEEMLREFSYLGKEKAHEVVIDAPKAIAARCEMIRPFPDETATPTIEGAEEDLINLTMTRAHNIYGDPLPDIIQTRLDRELGAITKYGFSVLYIIAQKLVKKSNDDGYFVCSRGSVGSSLVAFMTGITEVNALPPHYVCPKCKFSDFDIDAEKYFTGPDLPDRICPVCGEQLKKDGYTIPFETFLGFEGDKVPDIDLNFSGEYQPVAHKFCEELFGTGYVYRAGTITCIKDKIAYGYVKDFCEKTGNEYRAAEMNRLSMGCSGVKRSTGQHPGGIVVVPREKDVFDYTPLQHPADDASSPIITTHFDFNSMHDVLVKLDILGHDDPTMIRMLQDITGVDYRAIPQDDKATMSLFCSTEALGVSPEDLLTPVATYGVPEFGTHFVRQMLVETKPTTMEELVRISGLSHGTNVWNGNAQDLVNKGICTLKEAVCTRDDIMNYLISKGVDKKLAFTTMEKVRKGKGLTDEMEAAMVANNVPEWYIDSCKKIKYMFPRAHASAYVMSSFRVAYYKVHYPAAFYAAYFTVRADNFDLSMASGGAKAVTARIKKFEKQKSLTQKEKELATILELVLEMNLRGIELMNVDVNSSDATKFIIVEENGTTKLLPPFNSLPGLGEKAARSIADARVDGIYHTHEDIMTRAKVGQSVIDIFKQAGCIDHMPATSQMSLFG